VPFVDEPVTMGAFVEDAVAMPGDLEARV